MCSIVFSQEYPNFMILVFLCQSLYFKNIPFMFFSSAQLDVLVGKLVMVVVVVVTIKEDVLVKMV